MAITKENMITEQISFSMRDLFLDVQSKNVRNMNKIAKSSTIKMQNLQKIEDINAKMVEMNKIFNIEGSVSFQQGYEKGFKEGFTKGLNKTKDSVLKKPGNNWLTKLGEFITNKNQKPKKESGGPVQSGREYIVGEAGPELFVPNTSGQIITNTNLKAITEQRNINQLNKDMDKRVVYVPIIRNNKHTTIVNRRS